MDIDWHHSDHITNNSQPPSGIIFGGRDGMQPTILSLAKGPVLVDISPASMVQLAHM